MKLLNARETELALPYPALIEGMRSLFQTGAHVPDRHHHTLPMKDEPDGTLLLMPAWNDEIGCVKTVTVTPGNGQRSLPSIAGSVLVFDRATGAHLALLDGAVLTARRTAAASALAADYLASKDARKLLILGSGKVAAELAQAYAAVRPIQEVQIWNRRLAGAERLAGELRDQGWSASAVTDLPDAVSKADIVSAATLATDPVVHGDWLCPGQHLDLIGAFTPKMREADDCALQRAQIFVDTPFAATEAGELKIPLEQGVISQADILGTLADLCTGQSGRQNKDDITLFKTSGNALMDLAAAVVSKESTL